jgi:hypothetical protein
VKNNANTGNNKGNSKRCEEAKKKNAFKCRADGCNKQAECREEIDVLSLSWGKFEVAKGNQCDQAT